MTTHSGLEIPDAPEGPDAKARSPYSLLNKNFRLLTLGSLGVVYGDIGTSPLYAFREAFAHAKHHGKVMPEDVYGLLSLIIWLLILTVTLKYVFVLLRLDNRGEGGILSLMALARRNATWLHRLIFGAGLLGAGLFYGEAAITPAISVLSAVEGLKVFSPDLQKFVLPITLFILIVLFAVQKYGTEKVSFFFGPITAVWFLVMAAMGIVWIVEEPRVLLAFSPHYGLVFLWTHSGIALLTMGAVFLAVTGAEALYADLGHFGRRPIVAAWILMVFPCLLLNYLGQGAMVLHVNGEVDNIFFEMVPKYLLLPLVLLAGMATIIASQAVITGAFSVARQAVQMGLLPHLQIRHTSAEHLGQIYMPDINKWLLICVIGLCLLFGSSANIAAAYGISVTGTMLISTLLASIFLWRGLKKKIWIVGVFFVFFFIVEGAFFSANLMKFFDGGFISILIAAFLFLSMSIWLRGTRYLHRRAQRQSIPLSDLMEQLERNPPHIADGTVVFLTSDASIAPLSMLQNIKHNKVIHKNNIVISVVTSQFPKVPDDQRLVVEKIATSPCRVTRIYAHYGYMESPDVPHVIAMAKARGLDIDHKTVSYFIGHRTLVGHPDRGLPVWQEKIFIAMSKSATSPTDFYRLPVSRVVEMGVQISL